MAFSPDIDDFTQLGRNEAAAKLSKNKEIVRAGVQLTSVMIKSCHSSGTLPLTFASTAVSLHGITYTCCNKTVQL